ncbi:MAG: DUF695 domain-containing protein [Bacteroidia bacterium]
MKNHHEYHVVIPEEAFLGIRFIQEEKPGNALINRNLVEFEPKFVFSWHCSVLIECKNLDERGFPLASEIAKLDQLANFLDKKIKSGKGGNPNALFLAKITWNGTQELIWRVFDPELANNMLLDLIDQNNNAREFDFRIDEDENWELASWHLNAV